MKEEGVALLGESWLARRANSKHCFEKRERHDKDVGTGVNANADAEAWMPGTIFERSGRSSVG